MARSQDLDKPLQTIDDDVTAFAFARDGRIAYSARRLFKTKHYDLQRDDIWLSESNGKRRRLVNGEKMLRENPLFTYVVDSLHWSPNGRDLAAALFTTSVVDPDSGKTQDEPMTLLVDENGREIRPGGTDSLIPNALHPSWVLDGTSLLYQVEALKPNLLFSLQFTNIASGPAGPAFEGRTFLDYDLIPSTNSACAIERDRNLTGPPRLQRLDVLAQESHELATLDDYAGGLSVSPSGRLVAYYIDKEVLEVRSLLNPALIARIRIGMGAFAWGPDESHILLKRAPEKKSGDLVWITLPPLAPAPAHGSVPVSQPVPASILHGLTYRDFAISPDGRYLAVIAIGKRSLLLYPLPRY